MSANNIENMAKSFSKSTKFDDTQIVPMPKDGKKVQSDIGDIHVKRCLNMLDDGLEDKAKRDEKNYLIREIIRDGAIVSNPSGTKQIGSKTLMQALWKVKSKLKFLDYKIEGSGKHPAIEGFVTDGVATTFRRGGAPQMFRDKGGVFDCQVRYGDGFYQIGVDKQMGLPITYRAVRNENVYPDKYASGIRGVNPSYQLALIFAYPWEMAIKMYPLLEEIGGAGMIPGSAEPSDSKKPEQQDITEIAYYYNLADESYTVFAGYQCTILEHLQGNDYPFTRRNWNIGGKKEKTIPVGQFICQPGVDEFWNYGIGDIFYDMAVLTRRMMNLEINHMLRNTNPLTFINTPQGKSDELLNNMARAYDLRDAGLDPVVAVEYDGRVGGSGVNASSLLTQNLFNEWQALWDLLAREMARLGVNLDDVDRGANVTATQIHAEEEAGSAYIKQIGEENVTETEALVGMTLDAIVDRVTKNNKVPVDLTTNYARTELQWPEDKVMTMGMIKEEVSNGNWFVRVNGRTGARTSGIMELQNLQAQMSITPPGTPQYQELYRKMAMARNLELGNGEEVSQESKEQGFAPKEVKEGVTPSETDQLKAKARSDAQPEPLI